MESNGQRYLMVNDISSEFRDEVAAQVGSLDPAYCFQCGVCSGSCPTVDRMEYGPRRIIHMIRLGLADQVLRSQDIWLCVSCASCSARCPQRVEIAEVMSVLRNLSIARGLATDEEAVFSQTFLNVLQRHGRMYEMEVLLRFFARKPGLSGVLGLLQQAGLGMNMFRKGKIALRPVHIAHAEELQTLAKEVGGRE